MKLKFSNTSSKETDNNKSAKKYAINNFVKKKIIELDKKQHFQNVQCDHVIQLTD